jgi:hypothetical protein
MVVVGGLILLSGLWLVVTGLLLRSQLNTARGEVHQLRDEVAQGRLAAARTTLASLQRHAHRADLLASGPVWALAAQLPGGGEPVRTVRGIADSVDSLAHDTLPALLDARTSLDPSTLRRPDGSINLAPIKSVAPTLSAADSALTRATSSITDLPSHTWLSSVDSARTDILSQLREVRQTVHSADLGARIVPTMLGDTGVKRYFVGFQNTAEARGTGGLPGAFGILEVDHGKARFTRFENDSALGRVDTGLNFGPDYNDLYGGYDSTSLYVNSNASPHFPYAAKIWVTMWQRFSGQHLDGALALDPTTLSYLLGPTGAVTLPDGTTVDAGNVVALTESTTYSRFPDAKERRAYLLEIAQAVSSHIVTTKVAASGLVDAAGRAISERRLLVWSADPKVEAELQQTAASGAVPVTKAPYVGLWLTNEAGNKLDYYVSGSLRWQRTGCGATRQVTVTVTLTNEAPASGLSNYVINRGDDHGYPVKRGDTRDYVSYAATNGGLLDAAEIDGKETTVSAGAERGHPVYTVDLELPRGRTRTVVLHLTEPAGSGAPVVMRQPLIRPLSVAIATAGCGK